MNPALPESQKTVQNSIFATDTSGKNRGHRDIASRYGLNICERCGGVLPGDARCILLIEPGADRPGKFDNLNRVRLRGMQTYETG
jgi:hypothetical protein